MRLNRVGVLSAGKLSGLLYTLLGLIIGGIVALASIVGATAGFGAPSEAGTMGMLFGVGAVVILPILYGLMGFLSGLTGLPYSTWCPASSAASRSTSPSEPGGRGRRRA